MSKNPLLLRAVLFLVALALAVAPTLPLHAQVTVTGVTPDGATNVPTAIIGVDFSGAPDAGAENASSWNLTNFGIDQLPGGGDDSVIPLSPVLAGGSNRVDLLVDAQAQLDLSLWTEMDYAGTGAAGNWNISGDGLTLTQTINGAPTFLTSDFDFIDRVFDFGFRVNTGGDDDFIGFVFGFQGLGAGEGYYLFSWKQGAQSGRAAGMRLLRINDVPTNSTSASTDNELWVAADSPRITVLATNEVGGAGWADFTDYRATLTYESDGTIQIVISNAASGAVLWDSGQIVDPNPLGAGKIGFFNFSQATVQYTGLEQATFLNEGVYELTASAAGIPNLDGDGDGTPGDDFGSNFTIDFGAPTLGAMAFGSRRLITVPVNDTYGLPTGGLTPVVTSLLASGGDGTFGDGNETTLSTIDSVVFDPANGLISINLNADLAADTYQLNFDPATIVDAAGNQLEPASVLFSDDFEAGASPLWSNEVGGWTDAGGVYAATAPNNAPTANSSLPFALGDFAVEVDVNNVSDGGIWLRSAAANGTAVGRTGVLVVTLGNSIYFHDIPTGDGAGATIGSAAHNAGPNFRLRVVVTGNDYTVFVSGSATPLTSYTTAGYPTGEVALYSNSAAQSFDNVVLTPPGASVEGALAPPVLADVTFGGLSLAANSVLARTGTLLIDATATNGLASANATLNGTSLGTDSTPGDGLSLPFDITGFPDGAYTLVIDVTDNDGITTSVSYSVTVDRLDITIDQAAQLDLPALPGTGAFIEVHNGIGGGGAPSPAQIDGRTPEGTTLSPFIDFPRPGQNINVGNSFNSFFADTALPPEQVSGIAARNFILKITALLRVTRDLDLLPATPEIDLDLGVGSDDGFNLTVGSTFVGSTGDRGFTYSWFRRSFEDEGLYPVTLLFAANAVGQSGLEFSWRTGLVPAGEIIPQISLYQSGDLGDQLITFEEVPAGTVVTDQFADQGILFSTLSGDLRTTDSVTNFVPISAPAVLGDPNDPAGGPGEVEMRFVAPGTTFTAVTDFVSFYLIDAESTGSTVTAYDPGGTVLFQQTYNDGGRTQRLVEIEQPFLARVTVTLGDATDSSAIDNVTFRSPVILRPVLALSLDANTVMEGGSLGGTVTLSEPWFADLPVSLSSSAPLQVDSGPPLIIPQGQLSAPFLIRGLDDTNIEPPQTVTLTANAPAALPATIPVTIGDNDWPMLALTVSRSIVPETAGPNAITATITRDPVSPEPLVVRLNNSDPTAITVPAQLTIPAGQASAEFLISVVDDPDIDGPQVAELDGEVVLQGSVIATSNTVQIEVGDDEGPTLELTFEAGFLIEGSSGDLLLRNLGGNVASDTTVSLVVDPAGELTVPATVVIPAGSDQVPIPVTAVADGLADGLTPVVVNASTAGFSPAEITILLSDVALPDLVVTSLTIPPAIDSDTNFQVGFRTENTGAATASGAFFQRVFLSTDPNLDPLDVLLNQSEFPGGLAPGLFFERDVTVRSPRPVGDYWIIVATDPLNSVTEIFEGNNSTVSATPLAVNASYAVTVEAVQALVTVNSPVTFRGSATKPDSSPAPFSLVNIHIRKGGTERIIGALTNSLGEFETTWTALPGEGGDFEVGANHPGVSTSPATQDTFTILAINKSGFPGGTLTFNEGSGTNFTGTLSNPASVDLTGLQFNIIGAPPGLNVIPSAPSTTLTAGGTLDVDVAITADPGFFQNGTFQLQVTSDQGVTLEIPITVRVNALVPRLAFEPGTLRCSVLRGSQKTVAFTVRNTGGAPTGPIAVSAPPIPWLSLATPSPLSSLQPGQETTVSLRLGPNADVDLTQFTGNLALNPANGAGKALPFAFRVVSDLMGDLEIETVDEFFYFTPEAPKLEGAEVVVRDAVTAEEIATLTTGADGLALFTDLAEGWYTVTVSADQHSNWRGNLFVDAEEVTRQQAFLSRELVTYTWTVEEIEIEDRYRISVESTFETNVPAPVVTVTPNRIDVGDLTTLGQTKIVNMTIENHGFIAAENGAFNFGSHPFYSIVPLVNDVGTLPAKSTIVIPVTIKRIGEFAEDGTIRTLDPPAPGLAPESAPRKGNPVNVACGMAARFIYSYVCGPNGVEKTNPIAISGVQGHCPGGGLVAIGGFTGGGGPGGGGIGTGYSGLSFSIPSPCDCPSWLSGEACVGGEIGITIPGVLSKFASKISAVLPSGARLERLDATVAAGGKLCVCCKDGKFGTSAEGEVKLEVKGEVAFGPPSPPALIPPVNGPWRIESASLDADLGVTVELTGNISIKAQKECDGKKKTCISGSIGLKAFAGVKAEASIRATEIATSTAYEGKIEGKIGVEGFLGVEGSWCTDGEGKIQACAKLDLVASLEGSLNRIGPTGRTSTVKPLSLGGKIELVNKCVPMSAPGMAQRAQAPPAPGEAPPEPEDPFEGIGFEPVDFSDAILSDAEILNLPEVRDLLPSATDGVCAKVKIKIDQEAVMTRSAFRATLELGNNLDDQSLLNVGFDLDVRDLDGNPANELFNIRITKLENLNAIDGTGTISPSTTGLAQWTLIPRDTAAPVGDTVYTVGGTISYDQSGSMFSIPVEPAPITVRPDAALYLKYFHQRDVLADDPFTSNVIEPSVPYYLAVQVCNRGAGPARNLSITSAQPEIVDNEKGLLIDFAIIGTEVAGQNLSPSLTANFGTIEPNEKKIATWLMTCTLQGLFVDYSATFEHLDGFGDPRLSLLKEVEIHEMIRLIEAQGDKADGQPDFLVNDVPDPDDYPDTVHLSDGTTAPVVLLETATVGGAGQTFTVTFPPASGWTYLRIPDPSGGSAPLVSVERSDGRVLPLDQNTWTSDRTFVGLGQRPVLEDIFHLVDCDSTGSYTLTYGTPPTPDSTAPMSEVTMLAADSSMEIPVMWSGNDTGDGLAFYDIYVSTDGGPFELWLPATRATSSVYPGEAGRNYAFYSRATDFAGNQEDAPATGDAMTTVSLDNQPPEFPPLLDQMVDEGKTFVLRLSADDPDGPKSELRYSIVSGPNGLVIDSITGDLRWLTGETDGGRSVNATVRVTDAGSPAKSGTVSFNIVVVDQNSPPVIAPVSVPSLEVGGLLLIDIEAIDTDSPAQTLAYSLAPGAPSGMTIDPVSGLLQWTPPSSAAGTTQIAEVIVTDNGTPPAGASLTLAVTVTAADDDPPVFGQVPVVLWVKGQAYTLTVLASDPDGDEVAVSADLAQLNGATFGPSTIPNAGRLDWDPSTSPEGSYQVPLTATANGLDAAATLNIEVRDGNVYWSWVPEAFGTSFESLAALDALAIDADPDLDNRTNIHEMTFLTNPLVPDAAPLGVALEDFGDVSITTLSLFRRTGSNQLTSLAPLFSPDLTLGSWSPVPLSNWSAVVDAEGDQDGNPDTELIDISIIRLHPGGTPPEEFYQIESAVKP